MATLRTRTRLDRSRTLSSDVVDQKLNREISPTKSHRADKTDDIAIKRDTNRPFFGLTQVCRQLRTEYRPIYLQKQEIGMDLTEIVKYVRTFYYDAPTALAQLSSGAHRVKDMPFTGNLTIAVGDKANILECLTKGVEIVPLLDLWANSYKIEAGFGRYMKLQYVPENDGEAKDL
jgi:hypothetical protein